MSVFPRRAVLAALLLFGAGSFSFGQESRRRPPRGGPRRPPPPEAPREQAPEPAAEEAEEPKGFQIGFIVGRLPDPAVAAFLCGSAPEKDCQTPVGSIEPVMAQEECPDCAVWAVQGKGRLMVLSADNARVLKTYEIPADRSWWKLGRAVWEDFKAGPSAVAALAAAPAPTSAAVPAAGAPPPAPGRTKEGMAKIIRAEVRGAPAAPAAKAPAPAPAPKAETLTKEEVAKIVQSAVESAGRRRDQEEAERRKAEEKLKKDAAKAPPALVSTVDKPSYALEENPENYAVVVGIEKYADLPEAKFAERDAQAVRAHLVAMGFPERNVVFLSGARASKAGLTKNIESWLPNNVTPESTVFFYYSGHGAPDSTTSLAYLVPSDGDPQYLRDTAYSVKRLYKKLGALKAKRVIVALDACFSGAGGRSVLAKGTRPLVTKIAAAEDEADGKIVSLTASAQDEISGMIEKQGHGLFTYYLLRGLNGAAQGPDGKVTVKGLYDYLSPRVQNAARRDNRAQTPQLNPEIPDDDPVLR